MSCALTLFCACATEASGAVFTVTINADSGAGSLRQAILNANSNGGTNAIIFQISGSPPFSIAPGSALPAVSNSTTIDGTTQPGFTNAPVIELTGISAGAGAIGLQMNATGSLIRGLAINRFAASGVQLNAPSNFIQGNYIGTDLTGTNAKPNGTYGIYVESDGNIIGGTNKTNANVISGNGSYGVFLYEAASNVVQGNFIGVSATGEGALSNSDNGIVIYAAGGNVIGGAAPGAGNVISGNNGSGIYLYLPGTTGNLIQGNRIGLDLAGTKAMTNQADGISLLNASGNNIISNQISGNKLAGISINGASSNYVYGNYIGTDVTGRLGISNWLAGVTIYSGATGNQIGGAASGTGNLISGNGQDGIFLTGGAGGNVLQGNLIGVTISANAALPNVYNGVTLNGANSNTIGGNVPSARNVISGNTQNGVAILATTDHQNSVYGNYVGTDITGSLAVPNSLAGVLIQGFSNYVGNAIGGSNVIAGNHGQGVWLLGTNSSATANVIQGNIIGLNAAGAGTLGNGNAGIGVTGSSQNTIGGVTPGAGNVISANGDAGIFFFNAGTIGNQVVGNYIGSDITGTLLRGNLYEGIYMQNASANLIGGTAPGAGNLISANGTRGIWLTNAPGNTVQGNYIGTKVDGVSGMGNTFHGIDIDVNSTNTVVGGTAMGAGNRIAFSKTVYAGVRVRTGTWNNLINGNCIFSNGASGINLNGSVPSPVYSCESGVPAGTANNGQNLPVLSNSYGGSMVQISGSLNAKQNNAYTLEFFASPSGDSSGYGEGQVFLGRTNFSLPASSCTGNFTVEFATNIPSTWVIIATATDSAGNTSEFSAWIPIISVPPIHMQFAMNNSQITASWTNNGGNFGLQETSALKPPVKWTTVTNVPVLTNNSYVVTLTRSNTMFFRLVAP